MGRWGHCASGKGACEYFTTILKNEGDIVLKKKNL